MQQQIDLLNQELRDAKKQAEHAQAEAKTLQTEAKALGSRLDAQLAESKKLSGKCSAPPPKPLNSRTVSGWKKRARR